MRASDVEDLARALGRRFPSLDFRLLVATVTPTRTAILDASSDPRVAFVDLPRHGVDGWRIAESDWRGLFSRLAFVEHDRGNRPIDETLYWFGSADRHEPGTEVSPAPER